jgi:hypothetical protein
MLLFVRSVVGGLTFIHGDPLLNAFITAEDLGAGAVVVERPGERHLKPRLIRLEELDRVDVIWE